MLSELKGNGLLIHHWDTDGICSAQLLLKHLAGKTVENTTPVLGNYYLTDEEIKRFSVYDFVIVADMALPKENILALAKNARVVIFDHHLQEKIKAVTHINPIATGEDPATYPSTSWIITTSLRKKPELCTVLGIVGDHEQRIKKNTMIYRIITDFLQNHNLVFDDLLHMVNLLDSNYKLGDKQAVENAPHLLLNYTDAHEILTNKQWNKTLAVLTKEITRHLEKPAEDINGTIFKTIKTPYNIISTITRKLAWGSGKNTIVVNTGFFNDRDQIYVRSNKNVAPMITRGRALGFKCGGKQEVLGAIVPKEKTDSFVKELFVFLQGDNHKGT
jgi:single-stranded DNA-specific DHH superfamily exonuclease